MQRLALTPARGPSLRAAPAAFCLWPLLSLCLAGAGCAATDEADAPGARLVRFGVLAAPQIGEEPIGEEGWTPEDLLLEAVTGLSAEPDLSFVAVPGPLLQWDAGAAEAARAERAEQLVGALGSLAAPTFPALGPKDPPELVAALKLLPNHPGEVSYWGRPVDGLRPVVLDVTGPLPTADPGEEALEGRELVLIHAAPVLPALPDDVIALEVTSGDEVRLAHEAGRARLTLPPLTRPPHLYAIVELEGGVLRVLLRSATGAPVPEAPAPITLVPSP